jgi:hypothetical protein
MCQDHVSIRPILNHIRPEYKLFLFKSEISVYDKNIILFILKSKLDECVKDYFRTMCRDYVTISANLKSHHGQILIKKQSTF